MLSEALLITLCCLQFTFQRFQIGQHADDLDIVANDATEHAIPPMGALRMPSVWNTG